MLRGISSLMLKPGPGIMCALSAASVPLQHCVPPALYHRAIPAFNSYESAAVPHCVLPGRARPAGSSAPCGSSAAARVNQVETAELRLACRFFVVRVLGYFLNLLLTPTRPISPLPSRSIVLGSGTGDDGSRSEKKFSWNADWLVCLSA